MTSNKDNIIFEKTSFLQGSNSAFIKELYLKYLKDPDTIPKSWVEFFDGLDEDQEAIKKEILGPSWAPKKDLAYYQEASSNGTSESQESHDKEKERYSNNGFIRTQNS